MVRSDVRSIRIRSLRGGSPTALAGRATLAATFGAAASMTSWWPLWSSAPAAGMVNLAIAVSFVVTAALLWDDPEHRGTARALAVLPIFYLMSLWWWWPVDWQWGPLPILSFLCGYLWFVVGGYALVRYPASTLSTRSERLFFSTLAAWILVGKPLLAIITVPERARFAPGRWWPTAVRLDSLYDVASAVFDLGIVAFTVGLIPLAIAKARRVGRLELLDVVPALVAATLVGVGGGLYLLARVVGLPVLTGDVLRAATAVAALATPIAFLTAVLRRRLARNSAVDFLRSVATATTPVEIQHEMAATLDDQLLRLWCRTDEGEYLDPAGRPSRPESGLGRRLVPVCARKLELARVDLDDAVARRHPVLTEAVLAAAAMALDVRSTLNEVLASRVRLLNAENQTRHEIGRDLHDGVQPTLAVAKTRLSAARLRLESGHGSVHDALDEARNEIDTAVEEIRRLVRDRFPVLLRAEGLHTALTDRTERMPIPVDVSVPDHRLHPDLELNVYYLVSEALTNVVKHASASRASVDISEADGFLEIVVKDDGVGGAAHAGGSGIAGMADRAHVLDGTLSIESEEHCGTTITARLPSGWRSPTTILPSSAGSPPGSPSSGSTSPAWPEMRGSSPPSSRSILPTS
ncbi:sensor histidine kinase [Actinomycetospora termitidis]|uniref:sensor histidine kinase n=1 Tax=Actinomycetospora termitidis TaxID=3053470 RepID=UPI0031F317B8